jgi:hypothetical protein
MALKKTFTLVSNFNTDVTFQDCHIRVIFVESTKEISKVTLGVFKSAAGDLLHKREIMFAHNLDGANFIKQAYEHLKTLPEFAGATDC